MTPSDDLQSEVLRAYTVLRLLQPDWGGQLILALGLGPQGAALAMAANIAGAVCLNLEEDPELVRAANRSGCCDFIVTTLDEALRAMKNEARRHLPISIGLLANPATVLAEIVERGVQPRLLTDLRPASPGSPADRQAFDVLLGHGAQLVHFEPAPPQAGGIDATALLDGFLAERRWIENTWSLEGAAALRSFDALALSLLPETDELRRHWLRSASRIVQRQRPLRRTLWLTLDETRPIQLALYIPEDADSAGRPN